jgi:hypothetical protein
MQLIKHHPNLWFWVFMLTAQLGAFIIFKDLADISQWWLQSSREFTMAVWYARWPLTLLTLSALLISFFIWRKYRQVAHPVVFVGLAFLCLFNWYAGFVNTKLMFRPMLNENALFVTVEEAPDYLEEMFHAAYDRERFTSADEISVLVLETDQGALAYTDYYLLQPHVVEAGSIGGEEVVMTYCGLTNMGIAYSPVIGDQQLDLRAITQLRNNLVMADANTGEPIQQFWGTLERDGKDGPAMKQWPTIRMPFGSFRELYPQGKVFINGIRQQSNNPLVRAFDTVIRDGIMVHAVRTLQWQSDEPAFPTIKEFDDRLPRKQLVYGLNVDDDYVAYTKRFIAEQGGLMNVMIGGRPVVLYYDSDYDAVAAFYNDSGHPVTRVDLFGNSDQGKLARVETLKSAVFWFIWYDFHRHTAVNRA